MRMLRPPFQIPFWLSVAVLSAAALLGPDATWDTRNYHIYNAFAFLNKPYGTDIAPAHMQTWFPPTQDLLYFATARYVQVTPLLNALLATPHAVAVVLAYLLTCRLTHAHTNGERLLAGLAVAIGATGAAGGSTIATAMSEMLPACLFLGALLLLVPPDLHSPPSGRRVWLAG